VGAYGKGHLFRFRLQAQEHIAWSEALRIDRDKLCSKFGLPFLAFRRFMSPMLTLQQFNSLIRESLDGRRIGLVDVGASLGIHPRWQAFSEMIQVIGFEPNKEEFQKLEQTHAQSWIQAAVSGKKELRTLYLTKRFNNSSLLRPNRTVLDSLEWNDDFDVASEVSLQCVTLDETLAESQAPVDFLKLDTQGNEWDILGGASRILNEQAVVVEVETEFCSLYENQALFADVDARMREHGFYLQDLANLLFVKPRGMSGAGGPKGRLIQADSLYFKDMSTLSNWPDFKIAAALVAYVAYGYPEAGVSLLDMLKSKGRSFSQEKKAREILQQFHHPSRAMNWLPGLNFLTRCAKRLWLDFRPVGHSVWEGELGNRLR